MRRSSRSDAAGCAPLKLHVAAGLVLSADLRRGEGVAVKLRKRDGELARMNHMLCTHARPNCALSQAPGILRLWSPAQRARLVLRFASDAAPVAVAAVRHLGRCSLDRVHA